MMTFRVLVVSQDGTTSTAEIQLQFFLFAKHPPTKLRLLSVLSSAHITWNCEVNSLNREAKFANLFVRFLASTNRHEYGVRTDSRKLYYVHNWVELTVSFQMRTNPWSRSTWQGSRTVSPSFTSRDICSDKNLGEKKENSDLNLKLRLL